MSEWQPIETAPKDGTYVLGASSIKVNVAMFFNGEWCWAYGHCECHGWPTAPFFPITHWMPMPSAPAKEGGAK